MEYKGNIRNIMISWILALVIMLPLRVLGFPANITKSFNKSFIVDYYAYRMNLQLTFKRKQTNTTYDISNGRYKVDGWPCTGEILNCRNKIGKSYECEWRDCDGFGKCMLDFSEDYSTFGGFIYIRSIPHEWTGKEQSNVH